MATKDPDWESEVVGDKSVFLIDVASRLELVFWLVEKSEL